MEGWIYPLENLSWNSQGRKWQAASEDLCCAAVPGSASDCSRVPRLPRLRWDRGSGARSLSTRK
jgi:hypothetical protein